MFAFTLPISLRYASNLSSFWNLIGIVHLPLVMIIFFPIGGLLVISSLITQNNALIGLPNTFKVFPSFDEPIVFIFTKWFSKFIFLMWYKGYLENDI